MGFSFANVLDTFRLDVALTALETDGDGQIISSTKVTALNNKQAEIIQGRQIPVQTMANFTVTTQYVNAALAAEGDAADHGRRHDHHGARHPEQRGRLRQPGQRHPADHDPERQDDRSWSPTAGRRSSAASTGLEDSITRERVPFLHQIPILGALFKNFARTKQNRELLIFITPRIIK